MNFASAFAYFNPQQQTNVEQVEDEELDMVVENDIVEQEELEQEQNVQSVPQNLINLEEQKQEKQQEKQVQFKPEQRQIKLMSSNLQAPSQLFTNQSAQNQQQSRKSAPMAQKKFQKIAQMGRVHHQAVDTNVVSVSLKILGTQSTFATGDAVLCGGCQSVLNSLSKLIEVGQDTYQWVCEFCQFQNQVQLEEEEKPKEDLLTYVVESPQQVLEKQQNLEDKRSIIFVIDTSGSMCVTQPITQKIKLKNDPMQALRNIQREGPQFLPGEKMNQTYVSRLQCMQAAIEMQLENLGQIFPEMKVGLITFNSEVKIIGDGTQLEQTLTGDILDDGNKLCEQINQTHSKWLGVSIKDSYKTLIDKVWNLQENGSTALGPALLLAIELAGQGSAGSKIVICTDGIANQGLGNLENNDEQFYQQCAVLAKNKSIEVSIISIEGQECKLDSLIPLVDETQGEVTKVDPEKLQENFANILLNPIIATHVKVTFTLHQLLKFRNQEKVLQDGSVVVKEIGNVTEDSEITFEYTQKEQEQIVKQNLQDLMQKMIANEEKMPFQLKIEYRTLNGMRCLRVLTKQQVLTQNQEKAEEDVNMEVLGNNAQNLAANYAQFGDYRQAQVTNIAYGNYMQKKMKTSSHFNQMKNFKKKTTHLNQILQEEQGEELEQGFQSIPEQEQQMYRQKNKKDKVAVEIQKNKQQNKYQKYSK